MTALSVTYKDGSQEKFVPIQDLQFGKDAKKDFFFFKYNGGWVYIRQDCIKRFVTLSEDEEGDTKNA